MKITVSLQEVSTTDKKTNFASHWHICKQIGHRKNGLIVGLWKLLETTNEHLLVAEELRGHVEAWDLLMCFWNSETVDFE